MNFKMLSAAALSLIACAGSNAYAAATHLGTIPLENMVDVSFQRDGANLYTKSLREGGTLLSNVQNSGACFSVARTMVITDVNMQVGVSDPNSAVISEPAIVAWNGNNPPVMLVQGRGQGINAGESNVLSQSFIGGIVVTGGSSLCMHTPAGKYSWFQARASGYYPVK